MVELMVVVIIIGILASVAIPKYLRSVENGKADSGVAQLKMVGAANRMYAIDHGGNYVTGAQITTACNPPTVCQAGAGGAYPACDLVACKYLPTNDYTNMSYQIAAAGNLTSPSVCPLGVPGGALVACVLRNPTQSPSTPYSGWGYTMDVNGTVTCYNGGTAGCGGANGPPATAQ